MKEYEKELASCPPGTRKMAEDERLKILDELKMTR